MKLPPVKLVFCAFLPAVPDSEAGAEADTSTHR
jgi:hypothetical protein